MPRALRKATCLKIRFLSKYNLKVKTAGENCSGAESWEASSILVLSPPFKAFIFVTVKKVVCGKHTSCDWLCTSFTCFKFKMGLVFHGMPIHQKRKQIQRGSILKMIAEFRNLESSIYIVSTHLHLWIHFMYFVYQAEHLTWRSPPSNKDQFPDLQNKKK